MVTIVCCENCGGSHLGFDQIHVNVTLSKSDQPCEQCNHSHAESQSYLFCSDKCFHDFNAKVARGEKEYRWKEWRNVNGKMEYS